MRKLRPVEDSRRKQGDDENKWKFSISPDYSVDPLEITGEAVNFPEFMAICASGFDSTPYVCEILKRTIEWNIISQYRINDDWDEPTLGDTTIASQDPLLPGRPPFKIRINIAANIMWPLLVDEFSTAEKAATTLAIAGTMLHELSVSTILTATHLPVQHFAITW